MFQHLFSTVQKTDVVYAPTASFPGKVLKLAQSIASGFSQLFKANPYHDASGRFARKDTPAAHHFVSLGGKFTRSNTRDRIADIVDQTALGTRLRALFDSNQAKRLAQTDAPTTPVRRTRTPSATQTARAAALAQRQALAERRAQLVAERTALVEQNHKYGPRDILHLTDNDRVRLQAQIDNPNTYQYTRINAQRRLDGATHGDALRLHGLTLNSTTAMANRVPTHHLSPDSFGRSLHDLNQAQALRRSQAAQATRRVLGDRLFNMTDEERRTTIGRLGRAAAQAHSQALTDHVAQVVAPLVGLTHVERQQRLDAMSDGQRRAIDSHIGWSTRNDWRNAEHLHNIAIVESERVAREGPHTGGRLYGLDDAAHAEAKSRLTDSQRLNASAAESAYAQRVAASLAGTSLSSRASVLEGLGPRQRQAVESHFTPEQRASHAEYLAERAVESARATRAAEELRAIEQSTIDSLSPHAKQVHQELLDLQARGFTLYGVSGGHGPHKVAAALSRHYPGVTPNEIVNAFMGENAKIGLGSSISISSNGHLNVTAQRGSTVHGASVRMMQRDIGDPNYGGRTNVHHSYLKLDESAKGGGTVKKMFAASIPLYHKMGLKTIDVQANLEGGVYAWARYGFDSKSPEEYHSVASSMINALHQSIDPKHMTAGAKQELSDVQNIMAKHRGDNDLPSILTSMSLPHLDWATVNSGVGTQGAGSKFLASAMSKQGSWNGKFDMKNKRQVKHLSKYVGKDLPVLEDPA